MDKKIDVPRIFYTNLSKGAISRVYNLGEYSPGYLGHARVCTRVHLEYTWYTLPGTKHALDTVSFLQVK